MTDKELLELAAKAAGIADIQREDLFNDDDTLYRFGWNPLTDDGDALRLAVTLEMQVSVGYMRIAACIVPDSDDAPITAVENKVGDLYAATRRAIVRAAAEIGKGIK